MKSAEEIMAYLELAMKEALELHDQAQDADDRLFHLIVAKTIQHLIEEIK